MPVATLFPDPTVFLTLTPEEVASALLAVVRERREHLFYPASANTWIYGGDAERHRFPNYHAHQDAVSAVIREGWVWLRNAGLTMPAEDTNGQNGWVNLTRAGQSIRTREDFFSYRAATQFPRELLHPSIADRVWLALARGDHSDAVFTAFREVEERVRMAGGFKLTDVGVDLMRKAFNKDTGPLTDMTQPVAEREALSNLMAGAIGSYKNNPHSHRTVTIADAKEAREMVMLASHLLRIIDAREATRAIAQG